MAMGKSGIKKIGVMGGTFDPVHVGHLIIAERAREEFGLEKVLFIPSGVPPHKQKVFASKAHRLAMVELAVEGNIYFESCDIEVKKKKVSYTFDTVSAVSRLNPDAEIFLITGEDAFYDLPSWHRCGELARKAVFLVAPRVRKSPAGIPAIPFLEYSFIDSPMMEISSSGIRGCISGGKTVKYLVPDRIFEYIRRYNLYDGE